MMLKQFDGWLRNQTVDAALNRIFGNWVVSRVRGEYGDYAK
jgi:hypothetical protein